MIHLDRRAFLAGAAGLALAPHAFAQGWTPPSPERELRVPVRGGRVYVRVNGGLSGARAPVVFAHGGPGGTHAGFLPQLELAAERGIVLYDQLDCGLSDRPNDPANWTVERFVSEVDAIRAALDLKRFHLVGHSWGASIALEYAARAPAGLLSVTLGSPLISTRSWERSTTSQLRKLPPATVREILADEATGQTAKPAYRQAMEQFYARYMATAPRPGYLRDYQAARGLKTNEALYGFMWGSGEIHGAGTLRTYDGEPLLGRIAAPTLVVCGENDEMIAEVLRPLVRRIPKATLSVVPGAGHALPNTHPEPYNAALRRHFAASDAGTVIRYP